MKKKFSIIAAALLAALPVTGYAANCNHNAANDTNVCVNNSCFSKIVSDEKAKDLIDSILSGKDISGSSNIAEIIDSWLSEKMQGTNLDCIFDGACGNGSECDGGDCTPENETPSVDTDTPEATPDFTPDFMPDFTPDTDNPTSGPETENDAETVPPEQNETPDNSVNNSVSGSIENASFVNEVIRLVNVERNKSGLASLTADSSLNKASLTRAKEIVKSFSHTRPDGRSCFTALSDIGYSYASAGENIAYGQQSPASVVNAWMNSEGHRANILSSKYTKIGVGCHSNGGTYYWAQFFAG